MCRNKRRPLTHYLVNSDKELLQDGVAQTGIDVGEMEGKKFRTREAPEKKKTSGHVAE